MERGTSATWLAGLLALACVSTPGAQVPPGQQGCAAVDGVLREADALNQSRNADAATLLKLEALFRRALDSCPGHPAALTNLADVLERSGRLDEAVDLYHRAADAYDGAQAPESHRAVPRFSLGDVWRKRGDTAKALYWYRQGLSLDPADDVTVRAVRELTAGDPPDLVESGRIEAAIRTDSRGGVLAVAARLSEQTLPFEFDSAELLPGASAQVREVAIAIWNALGGAPRSVGGVLSLGAPVARIVGHADRRGNDAYNLDLSRRRALAVARVLTERHGIPASRLIAEGAGRAEPLCADDTETCHQRNRRVEIRRP